MKNQINLLLLLLLLYASKQTNTMQNAMQLFLSQVWWLLWLTVTNVCCCRHTCPTTRDGRA